MPDTPPAEPDNEIFVVALDLFVVAEGRPVTVKTSDGAPIILRPPYMAADHDEVAGTRSIPLSREDIGKALTSRQITVAGYVLRRPTVAQYRALVIEARRSVPADQLPPMPTDDQLERVVYGL
jgi:hypothetical protein